MPESSRTRSVLTGIAVVLTAILAPGTAEAGWARVVSGPAGAAARTAPAPPSGLVAQCYSEVLGLLDRRVRLTWSATPSAWADGYEIAWGTKSGGPYEETDRVPAGALSFVTEQLSPGLLGTRFYFVVRATTGSKWRSTNSNQVTRNIVGLGLGCGP